MLLPVKKQETASAIIDFVQNGTRVTSNIEVNQEKLCASKAAKPISKRDFVDSEKM